MYRSLEEIVGKGVSVSRLLITGLKVLMYIILRRRCEDVKEALSRIANFKHARHVAASVAVIGCTPHCAKTIIVQDLKPFLAELMSTKNMRHVVDSQEFLNNLCAKCISCTAGREGEFVAFGIWVGPDEIGHGAFVRNFAETVNDFDLVDRVD